MKNISLWGLLLASGLMLAGCKQVVKPSTSQKPHSTVTSKSSQVTKAKPQTATDKLLSQVTAKVPEDQGTQNNGEVTYSQFYQKGTHWYWQLTSKSRGTIAGGQIEKLADGQSDDNKTITLTEQGSTDTLDFQWLGNHDGYEIKSDHDNIKGDYVLVDAQYPGKWTQGAPSMLKGTWETGLYRDDSLTNKTYPYVKTRYMIDDTSKTGVNTLYKADKKTKQDGAGWGANTDLQYKQLGAGTYMLKSYNGGPDLTKVHYANQQLTINYQAPVKSAVPVMHRVANADSTSESSDETSKQTTKDVDTKNLTTRQVDQWIFRHLNVEKKYRFNVDDYIFGQKMNENDGLLYIIVRENHSTKDMRDAGVEPRVDPVIGSFRINNDGALETESATGHDGWKVVATSYNN